MLAIIVLQYRGWRDTVACLQSLVPEVQRGLARVVVVDNPGGDDACTPLEAWIGGDGVVETDAPIPLPAVVPAARFAPADEDGAAWQLIRSPVNDGFARGMNRGIRAALRDPRVEAVWLLNNDTVARPGTVDAIRTAVATAPASVGQWGTVVLDWSATPTLQCAGWCRWQPWLATMTPDAAGVPLAAWPERSSPPPGDGYVYGASWVLRASALRDVGLLDESGFLYGEELDWAMRARPRWSAGIIPGARVHHREGGSIGAGARTGQRSPAVDLAGIEARLRVSRRFFRGALPGVYLALLGAVANRLRRGQPDRALAILRALATPSPPPQWPTAPPPAAPSA